MTGRQPPRWYEPRVIVPAVLTGLLVGAFIGLMRLWFG